MASFLSPNRSSSELQALKKSIYDRDDYAFIISILCSRRKWMTKEKKQAKLLMKFIEMTNGYFVGAEQEFYDLVLKEVKHSGQNTTTQRSKWTHSYMGEKLRSVVPTE
jgi:hypothetical protein